jgi:hypothetical protein
MNRTLSTTLATGLILGLAGLTSGCASYGVAREPITPQRPTISNDTKTTAFGTFEVELGGRVDPRDKYSIETRTSVGLSPSSEVFMLWDPFVDIDSTQVPVDVDGDGEDERGASGVTLGFKQRLMDESDVLPATAIQFGTQLPIGSDDGEIGSGFTEWFAGVAVDRTFGKLGMTGFYQFGLLTDVNPDGSATPGELGLEHQLALDLSWALDETLTAGGELATILDVETDREPVILTLYGQYQLNPSMNLDAGARVGLSEDSEDLVFIVGLTTNLGRFF